MPDKDFLDGYENPMPYAGQASPLPLSQRVFENISRLENKGEKARRHSFVIIPSSKRSIFRRMGHRTFYRLYGLHYFSHSDDPNTCGFQKAIDNAHSKIYVKDGSYNMTATPTISKENLTLEGESWGAVLTPNSDINILSYDGTLMSAVAGYKMLTNNFLRCLKFDDPSNNQTTKAGLNFNFGGAAANVFIVRNTFEHLLFGSVFNGIVTNLPNVHNGNELSRNLFFDLKAMRDYRTASATWPRNAFWKAQNVYDSFFRDWFIYVGAGAGVVDSAGYIQFGSGSQTPAPAGNMMSNLQILADSLAAPGFHFNNMSELWCDNLHFEVGISNAANIGLLIDGSSAGSLHVRHYRTYLNGHGVGLQFTSTATGNSPGATIFILPAIFNCDTAIVTIAGASFDATFVGGKFSGNGAILNNGGNNLLQFGLVAGVSYPAVAATTFTAGASPFTYTNTSGSAQVVTLKTPNGISAISYNGQTGYPITGFAYAFYLGPGDTMTITWAVTAPVFNVVPVAS